jgi:hypothetical protein
MFSQFVGKQREIFHEGMTGVRTTSGNAAVKATGLSITGNHRALNKIALALS